MIRWPFGSRPTRPHFSIERSSVTNTSTIPMNDLARGMARDRELIVAAMTRVLQSGYLIMGPEHAAFQEALAEYVGVGYALGVASGTDALELAIKAAMPPGKRVVLTAANAGGYTSVASRRAGYDVLYADVDDTTLCLSESSVSEALTEEIGVVVVTHLYGNFTDVSGIVQLCHSRGILVIEDCAQALGARRGSIRAGSVGDIGTISFYPTKNLGALGDGGAVVTDDVDLAGRVSQLRQYGWRTKYDAVLRGGMNSRLDEIQAAILLARLPLLDGFNERRRLIIHEYAKAAEGGPLLVLPAEGEHHVAHLAVARSPERESVRARLNERGITTDVHFPLPDYEQIAFGPGRWKLDHTDRAVSEVFTLPCFPELRDDEIETVCDAIISLK